MLPDFYDLNLEVNKIPIKMKKPLYKRLITYSLLLQIIFYMKSHQELINLYEVINYDLMNEFYSSIFKYYNYRIISQEQNMNVNCTNYGFGMTKDGIIDHRFFRPGK